MTDTITFSVPGEIKGKGRPRFFNGRAVTPEATRQKEGVIATFAYQAMKGRKPIEGPVEIEMRAVLPIPASWSKKRQAEAMVGHELPAKRPDIDNIMKLAMDAINGIVIFDDAQVVRMVAEKKYGPQALTVISVKPIR